MTSKNSFEKRQKALEAARKRGQKLLKSGVLDPPPLKFLKEGMTPEEIRQKKEELDSRFQQIRNEERECWEITKELWRVCAPHPNMVGTPDGDSCPDCGWSSRSGY
jgi:hypothetical protein